ncbi:hypothetical protein D9615_001809 [Tricholomella constricta]|uniref:PIN domain-containing protein n=1 Tax=Tricholomella constricta TaxID=117010 RepID=A0A8H5HPA9_9AGAR|nr:hypothetical protein D9615_001809 [Tricholomella constricta]
MSLLFKHLRVHTVFGANTDVGKTILTTALVRASARTTNVFYLKPVSTGSLNDADDRHVQRYAGSGRVQTECLFRYEDPVSPHLAAKLSKSPTVPSDETLVNTVAGYIRRSAATGNPAHIPTLSGTTQAEAFRALFLPTILIGDAHLGGISTTIAAYEALLLRGYIIDAVLLFRDTYYRNAEYLTPYFAEKGIWVGTLDAPPPKAHNIEENLTLTEKYYDRLVRQDKNENEHKDNTSIVDAVHHLDQCHSARLAELDSMPRRTLDTVWWPFVQHGLVTREADVNVIDSAHSDFFSVYKQPHPSTSSLLVPQFDSSASWWTQTFGHAHTPLTLAAARAAGRYGHVMFPQATHLPALRLSEALVQGPGKGWAKRAFISDNGSTGMEVGIKMALRAFTKRVGPREDEGKERLGVLGLTGSYHGDTIGAMDACEAAGVYTCEWHDAKGVWLEPPTVAIRQGEVYISLPPGMHPEHGQVDVRADSVQRVYDVEERMDSSLARLYRGYVEGVLERLEERRRSGQEESVPKLAALVLEPLVMGAGGMRFVDPLFQRVMVDVVRSGKAKLGLVPSADAESDDWKGLPVIYDEVFVGLYRLGMESAGPLLGAYPDIAVNAKILTGGLVPLAVTLAREGIFRAFWGDGKESALLHGHSYSAHAVGCEVAGETLREVQRLRGSETWKEAQEKWGVEEEKGVWSFWDAGFVTAVSCAKGVEEVMALGCVLAIKVKDEAGGYTSHSAQERFAPLREVVEGQGAPGGGAYEVHFRTLGNVAYFMTSLNTKAEMWRSRSRIDHVRGRCCGQGLAADEQQQQNWRRAPLLSRTMPRKNKDLARDPTSPQPTDIDEKLTALRRRTAGPIRPRERPQPPPSPPAAPARSPRPNGAQRRPNIVPDADHDDFSRRLKISSSPAPQSKPPPKLFNPQADPIPLRRTAEPEALSDATSSSHLPRPQASPRGDRDTPARQLFDHRKDDPVRFSVLARPPRDRPVPTSKPSGDYVSASSTSSYANSISSSAFTLSSTTDGSSASSALFDRPAGNGGRGDDGANNVFSVQLKKLYRAITNLETKVKVEDSDDRDADDGPSALGGRGELRVTLKAKQPENSVPTTEEDIEREKWKMQIANHKQLAEYIHNLLEISLAPSVPASLRNIPTKYNIIVRLWTYAFHKLLESLRRASFASPLALEHLQDFIYYAYTFYTGLLEEPTLSGFKSGWLEALGDLARYRMAVAAMVEGSVRSSTTTGRKLTLKDVNDAGATDDAADSGLKPPKISKGSTSDKPAARIDDSPSPSVGIAAARLLEVEPETERWRSIARDWYGAGLSEQPGTGKLHHHLGLLCREVEGEDLKGVYHFVKSMTTLHPFPTSRESILPIWSVANQTRRAHPDAPARDLFVLLQGMLFTHIQLDDFTPTLARFVERLSMEDLDEREWIMMGIINVAAIFEFGRPGSVLGRVGGKEGVSPAATIVMTKPIMAVIVDDEKMDVDGASPHVTPSVRAICTHQPSPATSEAGADEAPAREYPPSFKYALQLTFAMLSHVLKHPTRTKSSGFARPGLNPYLSVVLTFLATVLKNPQTLAVLERNVPWEELAAFFARIPRGVMAKQGLFVAPGTGVGMGEKKREKEAGSRWVMLTSGCAPPLPEDWCLRGMEWVGRSVFERGYWKSGDERHAEIEVLAERELADEMTDGRIEDDDEEEAVGGSRSGGVGSGDVVTKRWVRVVRSAVGISTVVGGFTWAEGTREWKVEDRLAEKVRCWREQDRIEQEEEEKRLRGTRWSDDLMDVDEEGGSDALSEEDDDDENDTPEVKELKARRRYLQSLLQSAERGSAVAASSPPRRAKVRKQVDTRPSLQIVPGYSVLVVDTNILLSSLAMFASVVESLRWTVIVPLPVIMELDGLSSNASTQLSEAAQNAMAYISSHIRSHAVSLKVQTSKGNYLTTLSIRTEQVDFTTDGNWERNMDDLILKAAIWQEEHWLDRTAMLKSDTQPPSVPASTVKVVLLSLDRNLRLKARSRQLPAASEKDLAAILANAT